MSAHAAPHGGQPPSRRIPVVIVDDEEGIRISLRMILRRSDRFRCAAEFSSGEAALLGMTDTKASLAIMDVRMPGLNGVECIRRLKQAGSPVRVLVLSAYLDDRTMLDAANAGADGFLIKPVDPKVLLSALELCFSGAVPLASELRHALTSHRPYAHGEKVEGDPKLTDVENRIMAELSLGKSYDEIARDFNMSHALVGKKLHRIYTHYNIHNRVEALKMWATKRDQSR